MSERHAGSNPLDLYIERSIEFLRLQDVDDGSDLSQAALDRILDELDSIWTVLSPAQIKLADARMTGSARRFFLRPRRPTPIIWFS